MLKELLTGNIFYSENPDTGGETPDPVTPEVKTFTQDEVNNIISDRLGKEKSKYEAEIEKLNGKVKNLGFESFDDVARLKGERDEYANKVGKLEAEITKTQRVSKLKTLGVDDEFIDFVLFKVENEEEYEEFVKNNPRITSENFQAQSSNASYNGGTLKKLSDAKDAEEYMRIRRESEK